MERLGPVTLARIRDRLAGSRATIVPVLDLGRTEPVDRPDPPEWMRELVVLRERHCVLPWCSTDARRCDLDHIDPYPDPTTVVHPGRPGRTTLLPCAADTIGSRPSGAGATPSADGVLRVTPITVPR